MTETTETQGVTAMTDRCRCCGTSPAAVMWDGGDWAPLPDGRCKRCLLDEHCRSRPGHPQH